MANPMYGQNKFDNAIDATGKWYQSSELDLTSTAGVYQVFNVPAGAYVLGIKILITSAITAGSMDVDIGHGGNADMFVDGWDGTAGSVAVDTIIDVSGSALEPGVATGRYFSSADTIDIDINTIAGAGKVKLLILMATQIPSKFTS